MTKTAKKNVLGKGLGALIPQKPSRHLPADEDPESSPQIKLLEISRVKPNKSQPRVIFDKEKFEELCASIKEHGVIQPILVKQEGEEYRIIFGERRYRAVKMMGGREIPAIISDAGEEKSHIIALIENIQRENLNAIEEAEAYNRFISEFSLTQEQIAKKVGKSRPAIANILRLLKLPAEIQNFLIEKKLAMGHIRALLSVENPDRQLAIAKQAVDEELSVREVEKIVYGQNGDADKEKIPDKKNIQQKSGRPPEDPHLSHITEQLQHKFMCKIGFDGNINKGKLQIEYHSGQELSRILEILGIQG